MIDSDDLDLPATDDWVLTLSVMRPRLLGNTGKAPTRKESRSWDRLSRKHKSELIRLKMSYLEKKTRRAMLGYLRFRSSLGYIEGVTIPKWLMWAGRESVVGLKNGKPLQDGTLEV